MNARQLEQWCMGKDVDEVTDLLKNKYNARFVDEKIDDGGDEEGTYVKKRVLSLNGGYIDLYYLDTDGIISYVDIDTDNLMESKKVKKGVVKLNEAQLRKIIAESIKQSIFPKGPISQDGDEKIQLNRAIHELKEAISILEKFSNSGMSEKRLLEMAQVYCKRGMSWINGLVSYAK